MRSATAAIIFTPGRRNIRAGRRRILRFTSRRRSSALPCTRWPNASNSGPIVGTALFPIPPGIGVLGLEGLAYAHLAQLFWRLARTLATQAEPLQQQPLQWSDRKYSRRAYQAICDIPLDITKEELDRRLRVFGGNHWGVLPTIRLHGVTFRAVI